MAGRAKEDLPGGSLKYLFVYLKVRIFKCSYRINYYSYYVVLNTFKLKSWCSFGSTIFRCFRELKRSSPPVGTGEPHDVWPSLQQCLRWHKAFGKRQGQLLKRWLSWCWFGFFLSLLWYYRIAWGFGDDHIIHDHPWLSMIIHDYPWFSYHPWLDNSIFWYILIGRLDGVARGTVLVSDGASNDSSRKTLEKWWEMMENDGKLVENDGKWWKMVENDGKVMEKGGNSPSALDSNPEASAEHWISFPLRSLSMHWGKLFWSKFLKLYHFTTILSIFGHDWNSYCKCLNLLRLSQLHGVRRIWIFKCQAVRFGTRWAPATKDQRVQFGSFVQRPKATLLNVFSCQKTEYVANWIRIKFAWSVPSFWSIQPLFLGLSQNFP